MGKNSAQSDNLKTRWIMQVPVISTGHLTRWTFDEVSSSAHKLKLRADPPGLSFIPIEDGLLVSFAGETLINKLPADLRGCIQWAFAHGYQWLRFDCDGDTIAELPQYSWDESATLADDSREPPADSLEHDLWKDGDRNIPESICDGNGQVVLGLCKRCRRGEADLVEPCVPRKPCPSCGGSGRGGQSTTDGGEDDDCSACSATGTVAS